MNNVILVYDNHKEPNDFIKELIGAKPFGDVILKRQSVRDKFLNTVKNADFLNEIHMIDYSYEVGMLKSMIMNIPKDTTIIHIFSHFIIKDYENALLTLEKASFAKNHFVILNENGIVALVFNDTKTYLNVLVNDFENLSSENFHKFSEINFNVTKSEDFVDISKYENFQQYLSGGFDSRHFNSVRGDNYTVTKSSTNKTKLYKEYNFYKLLPEEMKMWFVMPYNYTEDGNSSSYLMERYFIPDLAIRWVHGAIGVQEFELLMDKVFNFITTRKKINISCDEHTKTRDNLFITKVLDRIELLKSNPDFNGIENFIKTGTNYESIDQIFEKYSNLYYKLTKNFKFDYVKVVSHGDLCFSNMLYHNGTNLLKLIDTKGASTEDELYLDEYYDIAKLSHSICGKYDFFNNSFHEITLSDDLKFNLNIDFHNKQYIGIFKKHLESNDFDFKLVRLYEASLFLSMLPLHMDYKQKVFGFILNAINIIEELEVCLQK